MQVAKVAFIADILPAKINLNSNHSDRNLEPRKRWTCKPGATIRPGKGHGRAPDEGVRKVRAPQGRMPANGWAVSELVPSGIKREADGQCNRKQTALSASQNLDRAEHVFHTIKILTWNNRYG
jgi:hypothetical protein